MKRNMGASGAMIRVSIGAAIICTGVMLQSAWGLVGLIPLTTGVLEWCAIYALLGISTVDETSETVATTAIAVNRR